MIEAPAHPEEEKRLASLRALDLLDTPIDVRFERITRLVRRVLGVPIAIFNLIDADRQHYKSAQGISAVDAPKPPAFCTHAILDPHMLHVPDAAKDKRFADNPFVTGELLDIGFYAGCAIHAPDGMPIGTLCAIDTRPRKMSADQLQALRDLADIIETELKFSGISHAQKSLLAELDTAKRLAMVDPLTRLWNRSGLDALINKEMNEAIRNQKPMTLALGDIDRFKSINDTHGHPVGDAVLCGVARALTGGLRAEDIVGRFGGEEFLVVLPGSDAAGAAQVLERLRAAVADTPFLHEDAEYNATISFGAVTFTPEKPEDAAAVIKKADTLLYKAKEAGRNCVKAESL